MSFRGRLRAPRVSLLVRDFKDRRNSRQRRSFAAIGGLQQALLDKQLLRKFEQRVAENVRRREDRKRGKEPAPVVHCLPPEIFAGVPAYLRAVQS